MHGAKPSSAGALQLGPDQIDKLREVATSFDIHVDDLPTGRVHFKVLEKTGWREFELDATIALRRLTTELCSKTIPWVYYRQGESCLTTLFSLPDKKLARVVEMYRRWKEKGFPD